MSGKPQINLPDVPQHVIQRGNNRAPCFFEASDYQRYLKVLGEALHHHGCYLHSYVLMSNHVHLLITPTLPYGISIAMQATGRKYVQYINRKYQRSGTLWEGRYKANVIDSDAWMLTCMRYIEMNPVRAGMVSHPGEYPWSSYVANAQGLTDPLVDPHALYLALGQDLETRQFTYRELFKGGIEDNQMHEIREMLNQELVMGRDYFKDIIGRLAKRQVRRGKDGRPVLVVCG